MKEVITNSIHPVVYPEPWHQNQHHRNGVCIHKTMMLWLWAPFLTSLQFQSDVWMTWEIQQSFIMTSASKYFFSLSGLRAWLGILIADFHTQSDLNIDIVLNNDAVAGHINLQSGLPVLMEYYQGDFNVRITRQDKCIWKFWLFRINFYTEYLMSEGHIHGVDSKKGFFYFCKDTED